MDTTDRIIGNMILLHALDDIEQLQRLATKYSTEAERKAYLKGVTEAKRVVCSVVQRECRPKRKIDVVKK